THATALTGPRRQWFSCRLLRFLSYWRFPGQSPKYVGQPVDHLAGHSVDRLGIVAPGSLTSPGAVFAFIALNSAHLLGSRVVRQWLWVMVVGSFGTVLLRPYYLVVGVPTTVIAWLMDRNDLLLARRFFPAQALLWCITLVGFASIARAATSSEKW